MSNERTIPRTGPADVVTTSIRINGEELEQAVQLLGILVHKEVNKIAYARLFIRDGEPALADFPLSNGDAFLPGNEIEVYAGYRSLNERLFKGVITRQGVSARQDAPPTLEVECRDAAFRMTRNRKSKFFHDMKDSDVFEGIIRDHALEGDINSTGTTHRRLVQYNSTDWDFMVSRAEVNMMVVLVNDGQVAVNTPDLSPEEVLNLTYGATLLEFETLMDARDQYGTLKSLAWDPAAQEVIETEAAEPALEEAGNLPASSLAEVNGQDETRQVHAGEVAREELQSWSDSALLRSRLARIRARVSFQGYAAVQPGDIIRLNGLGDRFNGKAYVSSVRHDIHEGRWVTHVQTGMDKRRFSLEEDVVAPPAAGMLPALHGLQIGVVTEIADDPEGEHRVRLRMPVLDTTDDGIWARVATPDAGDNRGTFFRPEIGDEVIVGFLNDDPRNPIILGMMNSSAKPPAFTASSDNPEKGYVSREGLKMVFNDNDKSITLETPGGNKVVLDDASQGITIEDQNGNKIEMGPTGISIESALSLNLKAGTDIKLEGVNITISPSASLGMSANGSLEVSSSGPVTIRGAIVQIN